jgi:hypothetical protein
LRLATCVTALEAAVVVDNVVTDERADVEGSGAVGTRANVIG